MWCRRCVMFTLNQPSHFQMMQERRHQVNTPRFFEQTLPSLCGILAPTLPAWHVHSHAFTRALKFGGNYTLLFVCSEEVFKFNFTLKAGKCGMIVWPHSRKLSQSYQLLMNGSNGTIPFSIPYPRLKGLCCCVCGSPCSKEAFAFTLTHTKRGECGMIVGPHWTKLPQSWDTGMPSLINSAYLPVLKNHLLRHQRVFQAVSGRIR